jgi:serine/threonine protein kinase
MYGHLFMNVPLIRKRQGNVLIDSSGNPCLIDFGLATVVGDPELQLSATTLGRSFDSRWRAPEVIGIDGDPGRPTFKSDTHSFGSVMFLVCSFLSLCISNLSFLPSDRLGRCTMEREEALISNLHRTVEKGHPCAS